MTTSLDINNKDRCKKQRKCYQNVKKLINFSSKNRIKLWIIIMVKKKNNQDLVSQ